MPITWLFIYLEIHYYYKNTTIYLFDPQYCISHDNSEVYQDRKI